MAQYLDESGEPVKAEGISLPQGYSLLTSKSPAAPKKAAKPLKELKVQAAQMKPITPPKGYVLAAPAKSGSLLEDFTSNPKNEGLYSMYGRTGQGDELGEFKVPYSRVPAAQKSGATFYNGSGATYDKDKAAEGQGVSLYQKMLQSQALAPVPNMKPGEHILGNLDRSALRTVLAAPEYVRDLALAAKESHDTGNPETVLKMINPYQIPKDLYDKWQEDSKVDPKMATDNLVGSLVGLGAVGAAAHGATKAVGNIPEHVQTLRDKFSPVAEPPVRERTNVLHRNTAGEVRQAKGQAPSVWLSPDAWKSFMGSLYPGEDVAATHGVNLPASADLHTFAHDAELAAADPHFGEVQQLLAKAHENAGEGGVAIGKQRPSIQSNVNVMREELNHTWQRGLANGNVTSHLKPEAFTDLHQAIPQGMQDYLVDQGYDSESHPEMVTEAAAKLMDGRPERFGVSPDEAVDFLDKYFKHVTEQHGAKALEELHHVRGIAADAKARAIGEHSGTGGGQDNSAVPSVAAGGQGGTAEGVPAAGGEVNAVPVQTTIPAPISGELPQEAAPAGAPRLDQKPLHEMSPAEIEEEHEKAKNRDKQDVIDIFGEEDAKKYNRLQRAANNPWDMKKADAASDEIQEMESKLTPEQQKMLYGIGDTRHSVEDLKDYRDAYHSLDDSSPEALGNSLKWAVSQVGDPTRAPETMTPKERMRLAQLRYGYEDAVKNGYDPMEVMKAAVKSAAERFSDPEDARIMLEDVVKALHIDGGETVPQKALPDEAKSVAEEGVPLFNREQVKTPEFKQWFGDSKVVDDKGEPRVVYHGTRNDFDTFDPDAKRESSNEDSALFFSSHPAIANTYSGSYDKGSHIKPVYLSFQNPLIVDGMDRYTNSPRPLFKDVREGYINTANEKGNDGVIINNTSDRGGSGNPDTGPTNVYIALKPEQVKSAVGNSGAFDPKDPNILRNRERRVDSETRKRVSDMSPEEMRKALLTSDKTGIPNRRAFDDAEHVSPSPAIGMSDADGLKALNDKFGYAAGDELLKAKAEALKAAGLDSYHEKGDEFLYRGASSQELKEKLDKARELLRERTIEVTLKDGKKLYFKGADFSYGTGKDLDESEDGLKQHKSEREDAGERKRGELLGITEVEPGDGGEHSDGAGLDDDPSAEQDSPTSLDVNTNEEGDGGQSQSAAEGDSTGTASTSEVSIQGGTVLASAPQQQPVVPVDKRKTAEVLPLSQVKALAVKHNPHHQIKSVKELLAEAKLRSPNSIVP